MSEHVATIEAAPETTPAAGTAPAADDAHAEPETEVAVQDLLVEEVSIDGMCGVY
jgi:mycofactocin precursor